MDARVAVLSIIVEDTDSVERLNAILHEYGQYIIGRMGIPYRQKGINIISVAIDAPQDAISSLSGRVGKLEGVSVKTTFTRKRGTEKLRDEHRSAKKSPGSAGGLS